MDITNPLVYGGPCFVAFILLELVYSKSHGHDELYNWKDLFSSVSMGLGSVLVASVMKFVSAAVIFTAIYEVVTGKNNKDVVGIVENHEDRINSLEKHMGR